MTLNIKSTRRKPRTVKNARVNLDDVFILPGDEYKDWLAITRNKLRWREVQLTQQRLQICHEVIVSMIEEFASLNSHYANSLKSDAMKIYKTHIEPRIIGQQSTVFYQYVESVTNSLAKWNGFQPKESNDKNTKKAPPKIITFRNYFLGCRKAFDSFKMTLLAEDFYIPIFHLIRQLVTKSEAATFAIPSFDFYEGYTRYFAAFIFRGLFVSQMKPSNTRLIWLVPASVYPTFVRQTVPILTPFIKMSSGQNNIRNYYCKLINDEIRSSRRKFQVELSKF